MSKEDLKKLKEIAGISVVLDHKTQRVQKNIEKIKYNNLEIEKFLEKEAELKGNLLNLLREGADKVNIKSQIEMLEKHNNNNNSLKLIEIEDIENNINQLDWEGYLTHGKLYAEKYNLDLDNPYTSMFSNIEMSILSKNLVEKYNINNIEKDDIIVSSVAGVLAGAIDVFLIGTITNDSNKNKKLVNLTDKAFEKMVN